MRMRRQSFRPVLDQLDERRLLSTGLPTVAADYTPAQILTAYGLNSLTFTSPSGMVVKGDGSGETIALIELNSDPNIQSDLNHFDTRFDLPATTITVVDQAGGQTDSDWSVEQALDVEWAHATAPGASILLVEAAPSSSAAQELQNLLNAVNTARNSPGVVAISMSWGFAEMANEAQYDSYFVTPAGHTGIAFIAASGDNGTVEYPAASPEVLAVGGTTLDLGGSDAYGSETAWNDSGGGYSVYEPEPSYQLSVQRTGFRSTPDVAFDGDPNTGVFVYSTSPTSGQGSWQIVAGTSLGAPVWAGLIASVDQGRALAGQTSLDGSTQLLPALYAAPSADFHVVSPSLSPAPKGGNSENPFDPFGLGNGLGGGVTTSAGATANTATGLGSPVGSTLADGLVASNLTVPLTTFELPGSSIGTAKPKREHRTRSKRQKSHHHETRRTTTHATTPHKRGLAKQKEHKNGQK